MLVWLSAESQKGDPEAFRLFISENGSTARSLGHGQIGEHQNRKRVYKNQHRDNHYRQEDRVGPKDLGEAGFVALKSYMTESFKVEPRFYRQVEPRFCHVQGGATILPRFHRL